ncbi:MAG TPA: sigma-70 family RNA polymerase sigma factor, partial [Longimicrobiales bacterium]|nr:sigma-70 family RNA polymerase sigma factor [Longimicrobiales bacterium]
MQDLFEAQWEGLVRIACGTVGSQDEAEDVVQDVFVRALARAAEGEAIGPGRLVARVKTAALDRCRGQASRVRGRAALAHQQAAFSRDPPDPPTVQRHRRAAQILETALASLSPGEREAFVEHHLHGLTCKEAGDKVGRSAQAVE